MIFLVTGCFGFIGKCMTNYLLENGHRVIGMDVVSDSTISNNNFRYVKFLFPDCIEKIKGEEISIIYHFAWCGVSSSEKNDLDKQIKNLTITSNVLKLAKEVKAKRVVIPGSISEFSKSQKEVTGAEKDTPSDLYAATKIAVRKISYEYCKLNNICLNWVLITSVYGGERKDNNLLTYTICNLIQNKKVETTRLEQKWDYIYIDDLINALYIVGTRGKYNAIYPIGSGRIEQLNYYVRYIAKLLNKENLLCIGKNEYKNKYIDNSLVDISKIKKLGFKCKKGFEENIVEVIAYYKRILNEE